MVFPAAAEVVGSNMVSTQKRRVLDQIKNLMKSTHRHSYIRREAKFVADAFGSY